MTSKRPVHLNLFQIRFPIPAIVSILHRASGVLLFLMLPLLLWLLSKSLTSDTSFVQLHHSLADITLKALLWIVCSALLFHLIAGLRHLLMDMGIGESLRAARILSYLVFVLSGTGIILLGIWLW